MNGQMSIFDCFPDLTLKPGDYVETHGAAIPHIMRKGYIGRKIILDRSAPGESRYQVGVLEDYIEFKGLGFWRAIIYVGKPQRILHSTYDGNKLYELKPWNWEEHISAKRRQKCQTTKSS